MYHRILLPTDGSPEEDVAVETAIDLAAHYDADLLVLHVIDASLLPLDGRSRAMLERHEAECERALDATLERAHEYGVEAPFPLVRGTPHERILSSVEADDCDLVVMATHGHRGLQRRLLGSTTDRVLRLSGVPVHVIPTGSPG